MKKILLTNSLLALVFIITVTLTGCEDSYQPSVDKQEKKTQPQHKQKKESEEDNDVDVILMPSTSGMTMVVV